LVSNLLAMILFGLIIGFLARNTAVAVTGTAALRETQEANGT
jgi:hypothetical protein